MNEKYEEYLSWVMQRSHIQKKRSEKVLKRLSERGSQLVQTSPILIYPDILERGYLGDVLAILEDKGMRFDKMRLIHLDREAVEGLYPNYNSEIIDRIAARVVGRGTLYLELTNLRTDILLLNMKGYFLSSFSDPNTIRGKFGESLKRGSSIHTFEYPLEKEWIRNWIKNVSG